jgi:hypothetical protein
VKKRKKTEETLRLRGEKNERQREHAANNACGDAHAYRHTIAVPPLTFGSSVAPSSRAPIDS